ncbi:putative short-chain dehydrogenase [Leptospira ryugenii]|uniref:Putative short-chain dehydrogenase n=1 Tax=Leptospira ryugenii TaxID=1917863 RepID=A0A2P2E3F6_9LEPT|nr:SDR family NAD(P)-dependent oxidoreductase [Leptospira ryugenii]GBF51418.1 putative short-chain dehydrogenase [Leptospira ryugenii]
MKLESKKVILTGASSGIGKALLNHLLKHGALVVVGDLRPDAIPDHPNLHKLKIDVSKPSEIDRLIESSIEILDKIDAFIANAGFAYYEKMAEEDWNRIKSIFATNVFSPIYTIQKLSHLLPKGVHILVTASAMAYLPLPGYALYSATKSALHSFAKAFRMEMGGQYKLTLIYPIATKTAFFEKAGRSVPLPWPSQSADHVAKQVIRALVRPKNSVFPSLTFRILLVLNHFFPFFFPLYQFWQRWNFQKWLKSTESEGSSQ